MQTTVSFPGLGIEEFTLSRVAFTIFGRDVYWYGVLIMLGIVAAFCHALWRSRHEGVKTDDVFDLALFIVPVGVIGARLYYVLTTLDSGNYKSFMDVIAIWNGGLAIYGGIIGGILAIIGVCLFKKINILRVMDMVGPGVMLAQAIGRWGNFCNGEAFGEIVPVGHPLYFLRMGLVSDYTGLTMNYYHPTFLYESLWNIVGFVIIAVLYRKKKFNGQNAIMYLTWYGLGRMFIEGLRTDSLYVGPFRISQVVGGLCFVVGTACLIAGLILARKGKLPAVMTVGAASAPVTKTVEEAPAGDADSASEAEIEAEDTAAEDTAAEENTDIPPEEDGEITEKQNTEE